MTPAYHAASKGHHGLPGHCCAGDCLTKRLAVADDVTGGYAWVERKHDAALLTLPAVGGGAELCGAPIANASDRHDDTKVSDDESDP